MDWQSGMASLLLLCSMAAAASSAARDGLTERRRGGLGPQNCQSNTELRVLFLPAQRGRRRGDCCGFMR